MALIGPENKLIIKTPDAAGVLAGPQNDAANVVNFGDVNIFAEAGWKSINDVLDDNKIDQEIDADGDGVADELEVWNEFLAAADQTPDDGNNITQVSYIDENTGETVVIELDEEGSWNTTVTEDTAPVANPTSNDGVGGTQGTETQNDEVPAADEAAESSEETTEETPVDETKASGYLDDISEDQKEAKKEEILNALFGENFCGHDGFKMPDDNDPIWNRIEYSTDENGNPTFSLNINPSSGGAEEYRFNYAWSFMNHFYPDVPWYESQNYLPKDVNGTEGRQNFYWSADGTTFSGTITPGNSTQDPATEDPTTQDPATQDPATQDPATEDPATQDPATEDPATEDPATEDPSTENPAVTDNGPIAPPTDDKEPTDVDLTIASTEGAAESFDLTIGGEKIAALVDDPDPDKDGVFEGKTIGDPSQYVIAKTNEDGSVTVSYYDYYNDGVTRQETPASTTQYNKDGSKVETSTDAEGNVTETRTSADGQTTSFTKEPGGKLTHVSVNGESYGLEKNGTWYRVDANGNIMNDAEGINIALATAPEVGPDGDITITTGSGDNKIERKYNPDGSLNLVTVGNETFTADECKFEKNGDLYTLTKYTSGNGDFSIITIEPDGSINIGRRIDGATSGEQYDSQGNLTHILPAGSNTPIAIADLEYNEADGTYSVDDITYIKDANGIWKEDKEIANFQGTSSLTLPDEEILFGEMDLCDKENGTYKGMTTDGNYVIVTTDPETGVVTVKHYTIPADASEDWSPEDGSEAKVTTYNKDGSKTVTTTTTSEPDEDGYTTTTTTTETTDANGKTATSIVKETKDKENNTTGKTVINTSADGQIMEYKTDKSGSLEEISVGGVTYTWSNEGCYMSEDGRILDDVEQLEDGSCRITDNGIRTTYGPDGSLIYLETANSKPFDMSEYKYDASTNTYTKILTTDGEYTQTIAFDEDGNITVTNDQPGDEKDDSVTYDKNGKISEYTIDGKTYKYNDNGELCLYENGKFVGSPVELEGPDKWGRYSIKEEKEENQE